MQPGGSTSFLLRDLVYGEALNVEMNLGRICSEKAHGERRGDVVIGDGHAVNCTTQKRGGWEEGL